MDNNCCCTHALGLLSGPSEDELLAVAALIRDGHTEHCAARIVMGDGECECKDVTIGANSAGEEDCNALS